jgi:hypothetical protein
MVEERMRTIWIRPEKLRHFGSAEDAAFCLITNTDLVDSFEFDGQAYRTYLKVAYDGERNFEALLRDCVPQSAHILVISPGAFIESPRPEALGARRKLMVMPCNSTPCTIDAIHHYLEAMQRTDPVAEAARADRFFDKGREASRLVFVNDRYGTRATFDHLDERYEWNQQAGPIGWGEQQIAPSGELSVLPTDIMSFDPHLRLSIDGEIALSGEVAIHSGRPSYIDQDRARIHSRLSAMRDHAVIATVEAGVIVSVRPSAPPAEPASSMIEALLDVDSRYRIVWEAGFGINPDIPLLPGNFGMNEPYGGSTGCAHWGLGLTPHTQYALILICPGTRVETDRGEILVGPSPGGAIGTTTPSIAPALAAADRM